MKLIYTIHRMKRGSRSTEMFCPGTGEYLHWKETDWGIPLENIAGEQSLTMKTVISLYSGVCAIGDIQYWFDSKEHLFGKVFIETISKDGYFEIILWMYLDKIQYQKRKEQLNVAA